MARGDLYRPVPSLVAAPLNWHKGAATRSTWRLIGQQRPVTDRTGNLSGSTFPKNKTQVRIRDKVFASFSPCKVGGGGANLGIAPTGTRTSAHPAKSPHACKAINHPRSIDPRTCLPHLANFLPTSVSTLTFRSLSAQLHSVWTAGGPVSSLNQFRATHETSARMRSVLAWSRTWGKNEVSVSIKA